MSRSRLAAQTLLGGIVVLIGLALLGRSTGLFDASALFVYVPSLFVLVGIYALVSGGLRNLVGPLLVILVAGAWQLVTLGVLAARDVVQFWPLLIILFGLSLLLGQYRAKARSERSDHVLLFAFFGGAERRITADAFRSADLTALFGGIELDLRDVRSSDAPAHVSTTTIFGGTEIRVRGSGTSASTCYRCSARRKTLALVPTRNTRMSTS